MSLAARRLSDGDTELFWNNRQTDEEPCQSQESSHVTKRLGEKCSVSLGLVVCLCAVETAILEGRAARPPMRRYQKSFKHTPLDRAKPPLRVEDINKHHDALVRDRE